MGEYATMEIPSSRQVRRMPVAGDSMSMLKGEYSICTQARGWTAFARRMVVTEGSERPMCLIFQALGGLERSLGVDVERGEGR